MIQKFHSKYLQQSNKNTLYLGITGELLGVFVSEGSDFCCGYDCSAVWSIVMNSRFKIQEGLIAISTELCRVKTALRCISNNKHGFPYRITTKLFTGHCSGKKHEDVIKCIHFPCYRPFVRGSHQSPVNSQHKGQWRGALMFSLICSWINAWVNNGEAGDLRRNRAHYDVTNE